MRLDSLTRTHKYNSQYFMGAWSVLVCLVAFMLAASSPALSQKITDNISNKTAIRGTVLDVEGKPVSDARVLIKREGADTSDVRLTDSKGAFSFPAIQTGTYSITADKLGQISNNLILPLAATAIQANIDLVLNLKPSSTKTSDTPNLSLGAMQFADQPNFTVAGVTDFTAAGGHGSDSTLRTSEALAVEASNLKPDERGSATAPQLSKDTEDRLRAEVLRTPTSFNANHRLGELYFQAGRYFEAIPLLQSAYQIDNQDRGNEYDLALACKAIGDPAHSKKYVQELLTRRESGDLYRLAAELDESVGDSLAAVREYKKAVSLDPSETNFFAWGSELLLHRAIWQAQQVFEQGAKQYPASSRMLTGLGTALFSGAAYEEAAANLCKASDLKPSDQEPYIFLGKVQMAAPNQLGCIDERLQRFVRDQPGSAAANYLYAMSLQKREDYATNPESKKRSEAFLKAAIAIDPSYGEAYMQVGILYASQKDFAKAIVFYKEAIAANPRLGDAHYRLAVAYDRMGQSTKAKDEFALHDEIAKQQAAETERQRQEIKQFLVVLPAERANAQTQ